LIEAFHRPAIIDSVLFGMMDRVVGYDQALCEQAAKLLAGMWLGDALCRWQRPMQIQTV
jgi:hypothetical protein